MRGTWVLTAVLVPGVATAQGAPQAAEACERLAALALPNTAITLAEVVDAGRFVPPRARGRRVEAARPGSQARSLPCRTCRGG